MMKKVKSTGKVGRCSFFDRIKLDAIEAEPMKENININHIRQSSYKLERSKSHRKGHSLERKVPIVPSQGENHKEESVLREISLDADNIVPQEFTVRFEQKTVPSSGPAEPEKIANMGQSIKDLFNLLHLTNKACTESSNTDSGHPQTEVSNQVPLLLEEEKEMLSLIKIMWQTCGKMKQKGFFMDQVLKMMDLLKTIVLKLAKPKLQILQQHSNFSLKVPPFKYSSPNNVASFESKQQSVQNFRSNEDRQHSNWMATSKTEEVQGEELQFKKIMYILDENNKKSQHQHYDNRNNGFCYQNHTAPHQKSQKEEVRKDTVAFFDSSTTKQMRNSKSHLSSFNSQQTQRTNGALIYEQEKINNSYSNDKLFLKNIVKKAKKTPLNIAQHNSAHHNYLQDHRVSSIPSISPLTSQQTSKSIQQKSSLVPSVSQDLSQMQDHSSISYQISISSVARSKTQSREADSESKRATLNNIINMLNTKYNKNIQLQTKKPNI